MPQGSLRTRMLAAFLLVAVAAVGTVGIAVLLIGPRYFAEAMGHMPGDPMGDAMAHATLGAFTEAMVGALAAATMTAVVTAAVVSVVVAARIARPITRLADVARRIAQGHYAERVDEDDPGELGDLAISFNEMATSLEATERRRLQLVGDVAHELRTPLSTLDGYLEGLEDGVIAPTPATWRLLRAETGRLTRMVNDLAELWRAEAHQLTIHRQPVDVVRVARDVGSRFLPQAQQRQVAIDLPTGHAIALADRDRLAQIVSNYLSNALRHAPPESRIVVAVRQQSDVVRLSVADQGQGLADDQLEAVFERFYRVDSARSRADGGSGIGLAIVRALATAMGGEAWAESEGVGRGATFLVEVPAP